MARTIQEPSPLLPAPYADADVGALQALAKGEATPEQQQRALNWIIYQATGTYDETYRQNDRDHAFASGKRHVGLQIVKMLKLNLAKIGKARVPN